MTALLFVGLVGMFLCAAETGRAWQRLDDGMPMAAIWPRLLSRVGVVLLAWLLVTYLVAP